MNINFLDIVTQEDLGNPAEAILCFGLIFRKPTRLFLSRTVTVPYVVEPKLVNWESIFTSGHCRRRFYNNNNNNTNNKVDASHIERVLHPHTVRHHLPSLQ